MKKQSSLGRLYRASALSLLSLAPILAGCSASPGDDDGAAGSDRDGDRTGSVAQAELLNDGVLSASPSITSWGAGRLDVVVRGTDNAVYHRFYQGGWSPWFPLGGYITSKPVIVATGYDRLSVFARGGDGSLWHRKWSGAGWEAWANLGGTLTEDGPAAASDAAGNVDVFTRAPDNTVGHLHFPVKKIGTSPTHGPYTYDAWSDWETLGGHITSAPAAVSVSAGVFDVFARWEDGSMKQIHYPQTYTIGRPPVVRSYEGWSAWKAHGGALISAPAASRAGTGTGIHVYARGTDGELYQRNMSPFGWSDWQKPGFRLASDGALAGDPSSVAFPGESCDHVVSRTASNMLWHKDCGETTTVDFSSVYSDARYRDTKPAGVTGSWDGNQLGAVVSGYPSATTGASSYAIQGSWPRELVVLESDDAYGPASDAPFIAGRGGRFATLPAYQKPAAAGFDFTDPGSIAVADTVSMPVRAARLIDHGTCNTKMDFLTGWDLPYLTPGLGFLMEIDNGIYAQIKAEADKQGANVYPKVRSFQPSFLRAAGAPTTSANDDGFSLSIKYEIGKFVPTLDVTARVEVEARASYRIGLRDGALDITPVGSIYAKVTSNAAAEAGKLILGSKWSTAAEVAQMFRTELPARVHAAALAKSSTPYLALCKRTGGQAAADADCSAKRGVLAGVVTAQLTPTKGAIAAKAEASSIVDALDPRGFQCEAREEDPSVDGTCKWHPVFKRVNVTPDHVEMVWYDGKTPSPEFRLVSALKPSEVAACSPTPIKRAPVGVPVASY